MPVQMTVTEVIEFHAKQLVRVLKEELEYEKQQLLEKLHLRTLERIFIEERIYKEIEQMKTEETVIKAVKKVLFRSRKSFCVLLLMRMLTIF